METITTRQAKNLLKKAQANAGTIGGKAGKQWQEIATGASAWLKLGEDITFTLSECALLRKLDIPYEDKLGEWNGYGYNRLGKVSSAAFRPQLAEFLKKSQKEVKKMAAKPKKESKKEPKDKRLRWAERLARLTGISVEEALEIAKAKEDYHAECILDLENRQCNDFSRRREKIIRTKERENPLRRIEDEDHAEAILYAHARHTDTDYEDYLAAANDLVIRGHLTHDDKRGWARAMAQGQAWAKDIYSALTY